MNFNRFKALAGFLLPLMFGLQVVTLISAAYLYLESADLRKSDENILTLLTDLEKEIKSSGLEQRNLFQRQTESGENKQLFSEDLVSEDIAILNEKIAGLSKLIEDRSSDGHDVIGEDYEYLQEQLEIEPKELFSKEYPDNIDADIVLIKDEISKQFFHGEVDGVEFNSIECRARSCRVDLDLSNTDMINTVQNTLAANIGRNHLFEVNLDENGHFTMYFSVDE